MKPTRFATYFVEDLGNPERHYNFQVLDTLCGKGLTKSLETTRKTCNRLQAEFNEVVYKKNATTEEFENGFIMEL